MDMMNNSMNMMEYIDMMELTQDIFIMYYIMEIMLHGHDVMQHVKGLQHVPGLQGVLPAD